MRVTALFAILAIFFSTHAFGKERAQVCAKYRTSNGWSQAYKVDAIIVTGNELNEATGTLYYQGFDTYVVIFWRQDEASVIQMELPYVTYIDETGYDQQGRAWQIHRGSICF